MIRRIEIGIGGRGLAKNRFAWVESLAASLLLRGVVFSKPDGSIRISAEGDEQALQQFADKVERGGLFAAVENFFVKWEEPSRNNFHVLVGA